MLVPPGYTIAAMEAHNGQNATLLLTFPTSLQTLNLDGLINTRAGHSLITLSSWQKLNSNTPYSMLPKPINFVTPNGLNNCSFVVSLLVYHMMIGIKLRAGLILLW